MATLTLHLPSLSLAITAGMSAMLCIVGALFAGDGMLRGIILLAGMVLLVVDFSHTSWKSLNASLHGRMPAAALGFMSPEQQERERIAALADSARQSLDALISSAAPLSSPRAKAKKRVSKGKASKSKSKSKSKTA